MENFTPICALQSIIIYKYHSRREKAIEKWRIYNYRIINTSTWYSFVDYFPCNFKRTLQETN